MEKQGRTTTINPPAPTTTTEKSKPRSTTMDTKIVLLDATDNQEPPPPRSTLMDQDKKLSPSLTTYPTTSTSGSISLQSKTRKATARVLKRKKDLMLAQKQGTILESWDPVQNPEPLPGAISMQGIYDAYDAPPVENKEPPPPRSTLMHQDKKLSPSLTTYPTTSTSGSTSVESKTRNATARVTKRKKDLILAQKQGTILQSWDPVQNAEPLPGAISMQGISDANDAPPIESRSMMMDATGPGTSTNTNEEEVSSMIVAAELVPRNDEESPDFVPGELWEKKVQEEVQTRLLLMTRQENMVVAEAISFTRNGE